MAVTHKVYGPAAKNLAAGSIGSLSSSSVNITVALMTSVHTFNQDHEYWADVSANEVTSTSYTVQSLNEKALTYGSRITVWSASSETQFCSSGTITAYFGVVKASSYLVSCIDFDGEQACSLGEFDLLWNAGGIVTFTVSS